MRKKFTLAFLFFICAIVNSFSQWQQTKGPYGSRTTAMITVGDNIYAANRDHGGTDGRVYRSSNFGQEWVPADQGIGAGYVQQFANIGETIIAASANFFGVYRTTNQGNNWTAQTAGVFAPAMSIEAIGDTFWLGTDGGGIFRSVDDGLTFQPRNTTILADIGSLIVYDIAYLNGNIFLACEGGGGPALLFRSSDNGASWEYKNTGLPLGSNPHQFTVNGNTLFVSIIGDFPQYTYGLFKSDDNGNTWTECNNGIPIILNGNTGEIWAHNSVVYASVTFPDANPKVYKSLDNGNSFIPASTGLHLENQVVEAYTAAGGYIFSGGEWYSSVYRSANEGATWEEARRGLNNTEIFSLMEHNGRVYAGAQEGLFYTTDGGENWSEMLNGLPYGLPVTTMEKNGSNIYLGTDQYGIYRSVNNGASWTLQNNGLNSTFSTYVNDLLFYNNTIYAATWDGIYRSTNNGDSWTLSSNGLPTAFGGSLVEVYTISVLDGVLFAGTVLEGIFKSVDGGTTWTASSTGLPFPARTVRDILPLGTDLLAATDDGVFRSTNAGASWTLTALDGGSMKRVYAGNGVVYASQYGATVLTGFSMYRSVNNGVDWEPLNDGMFPNSRITAFLYSGGFIYAGTDTRSVWRRPGSIVPVALLDLEGHEARGGNLLTWRTSSEQGNSGFEIQHSKDGRNFSNIGFVNSRAPGGNSNMLLDYSFLHKDDIGEINWYRLSQKDLSGHSNLSNTIVIKSTGKMLAVIESVYPTPAHQTLTLRLGAVAGNEPVIMVFDSKGRKLLQQRKKISGELLHINISSLAPGTYLLQVLGDEGIKASRQFIKQ